MGPLSYMRSVFDRKVVMQRMTAVYRDVAQVYIYIYIWAG